MGFTAGCDHLQLAPAEQLLLTDARCLNARAALSASHLSLSALRRLPLSMTYPTALNRQLLSASMTYIKTQICVQTDRTIMCGSLV